MKMDIEEALEICPQFKGLIAREKRLVELEKEIEAEKDVDEKLDRLECYKEFSKIQCKKAIETGCNFVLESRDNYNQIYQETTNAINLNKKLADTLNNERELLDVFYFTMLKEPRIAYSLILKHVDRSIKKEDQSGQAWMWNLEFPFRKRLTVAWKLLFGKDEIEEVKTL